MSPSVAVWMKTFRCGIVFAALAITAELFAQPTWTSRTSGTTANLWGAAYASDLGPGLLVVVGEQGTILSSSDDGANWTRRDAGTSAWLTAVTYDSVTKHFYAVGEGGLILASLDGISWLREFSPTNVRLNAVVSGPGGGNVSAVGEAGAGLLVRDLAGNWNRTDAGFSDRWMRDIGASYAVGQSGAIFIPPSTPAPSSSWPQLETLTSADLEAAITAPGPDGFNFTLTAVGAGGTILQRDPSGKFLPRVSGTSERLRAVCYRGAGSITIVTLTVRISLGEYFAVGTNGTILRSADGITWQTDVSPTRSNLNRVISTAKTVIALGDGGTILQTVGAAPVIVREPTTGTDPSGKPYATAEVAGSGVLSYLWLELTGGAPHIVGRNYPQQSLAQPPFLGNGQRFELIAANAFGITRSAVFTPHRFIDLASRAVVGTGENILVSGFSISDVFRDTTFSHRVLVRAIGPGLAAYGVTDSLQAPRLTIFSGSQVIATSTAWELNSNAADLRAAAQSAGAFPLTTGSADAALLLSLLPGNYTAQVSSADGRTGVALVEVYEVDPLESRRLSNLSARARVQAGAGALIGGLVIEGGAKKSVLLRAAGPTLKTFGLQNVLARPKLTLFQGNNVIATATAWSTAPNAAALRDAAKTVGAFPFAEESTDAALLIQIEPGAYTLQVSGADGGDGVALVEVYEQP